jgi:hypothetical protein
MDFFPISTFSLVQSLVKKLGNKFVCTDYYTKSWYEFRDHRWMKMDVEGYETFQTFIKKELDQLIITKIQECALELESVDEQRRYEVISQLQGLVAYFRKDNILPTIMYEYRIALFDSNFESKLNQNYKLICFENGVYDLDLQLFRDGKPDDYLSLCTGYKYIKHDPNDERTEQIKKFLEEIQPSEKLVKDFLMNQFAGALGGIGEFSFDYFMGSGANGKTTLIKLVCMALGDYAIQIGARAIGTLTNMNGIRVCVCTDTSLGVANWIKFHNHRSLLGIMECDKFPDCLPIPSRTWDLINVVPFKAVFREKHKTHMSDVVVEWRQIFMSMLIENYQEVKANGLYHPAKIMEATLQCQFSQ